MHHSPVNDLLTSAPQAVGNSPDVELGCPMGATQIQLAAHSPLAGGRNMVAMPLASDNREVLLPLDIPEDNLSLTAGIFPGLWIKKLFYRDLIGGKPLAPRQIQPADFDLRLWKCAYKIQPSF